MMGRAPAAQEPARAECSCYRLSARDLLDTQAQLNGRDLALGANDALPVLSGAATGPRQRTVDPASITFLAIPDAHNAHCR